MQKSFEKRTILFLLKELKKASTFKKKIDNMSEENKKDKDDIEERIQIIVRIMNLLKEAANLDPDSMVIRNWSVYSMYAPMIKIQATIIDDIKELTIKAIKEVQENIINIDLLYEILKQIKILRRSSKTNYFLEDSDEDEDFFEDEYRVSDKISELAYILGVDENELIGLDPGEIWERFGH